MGGLSKAQGADGNSQKVEEMIDKKIANFDTPYDAKTEAPPNMAAYHPSFAKVEEYYENLLKAAIETLEDSKYHDAVTQRLLEDALRRRKVQYGQDRILGLVGDSGVGRHDPSLKGFKAYLY